MRESALLFVPTSYITGLDAVTIVATIRAGVVRAQWATRRLLRERFGTYTLSVAGEYVTRDSRGRGSSPAR